MSEEREQLLVEVLGESRARDARVLRRDAEVDVFEDGEAFDELGGAQGAAAQSPSKSDGETIRKNRQDRSAISRDEQSRERLEDGRDDGVRIGSLADSGPPHDVLDDSLLIDHEALLSLIDMLLQTERHRWSRTSKILAAPAPARRTAALPAAATGVHCWKEWARIFSS